MSDDIASPEASSRAPNAEVHTRRMSGTERFEAFRLLRTTVADEGRLGSALALFVERDDLGFVWLAIEGDRAVGACAVSYAISLQHGCAIAAIDHLVIEEHARRRGVGRTMVEQLAAHLRTNGFCGLEVSTPPEDVTARAFVAALGFSSAGEERFIRDL